MSWVSLTVITQVTPPLTPRINSCLCTLMSMLEWTKAQLSHLFALLSISSITNFI